MLEQQASTPERETAGKKLSAGLWLLLLIVFFPAFGEAPRQTLQEQYHKRWTQEEGVPRYIKCIAQGADGYLWLGTTHGLFSFDGISFEQYRTTDDQGVLTRDVSVVAALPGGGLWIGYELGGASFLNVEKHSVRTYSERDGLSPGTVRAFAKDKHGMIWAATRYGLIRLRDERWTDVGPHWKSPDDYPDNLFVDSRGTLWTSTRLGLSYLRDGQSEFSLVDSRRLLNVDFTEAPDGTVWQASFTGLVRAITTKQGAYTTEGAHFPLKSEGIHADRHGALWITTTNEGLYRVENPENVDAIKRLKTQNVRQREGLTSDFAFDAVEDREGGIWIATAGGLDHFRSSFFTSIHLPPNSTYVALAPEVSGTLLVGSGQLLRVRHGQARVVRGGPDDVFCTYHAPSGESWLGSDAGIWRLSQGRFNFYPGPPGLETIPHSIQAITMDQTGALWASYREKGVFRLYNGAWTPFGGLQGLPDIPLMSMFTDSRGAMWFGYVGNQLALVSSGKVVLFGRDEGLDIGTIQSIHEIQGRIWIGGESGLEYLNGGRFYPVNLTSSQTLEGVTGITTDARKNLWLNTGTGVFQLAVGDIEAVILHPQQRITAVRFDELDGISGKPQQVRPLSSAVSGGDGRVYFAFQDGLVWLDPQQVSKNLVPPPVWIHSISADKVLYTDPVSVKFLPHTANVVINYTATSLLNSKKVRFKYRLRGIDPDWQQVGSLRQAFYSRLPPGTYRFDVTASNNDGIWNDSGASVVFDIPPYFTQRLSFRILCVAVSFLVLWLFYLLRIRQITKTVKSHMQERVNERERIARELHDTFLQGIQGLLLSFHTATQQLRKDEPTRAILEQALGRSDTIMTEGRELVLSLRGGATEATDLSSALLAVGKALPNPSRTEFGMLVTGEVQRLHPIIRDEIYQIGREAISNAFRHANANKIEVELVYGMREFLLRVRDDGLGIEPDVIRTGHREGHWGLPGMRERAHTIGANLEIWSEARAGTEVEVKMQSRSAYRCLPAPKQSFRQALKMWKN